MYQWGEHQEGIYTTAGKTTKTVSLRRIAARFGYEFVTGINPPLHGVTFGWRGHGTMLSDHGDYLLFHYHGGNRTIRTKRQLERVTKFLDDKTRPG